MFCVWFCCFLDDFGRVLDDFGRVLNDFGRVLLVVLLFILKVVGVFLLGVVIVW